MLAKSQKKSVNTSISAFLVSNRKNTLKIMNNVWRNFVFMLVYTQYKKEVLVFTF